MHDFDMYRSDLHETLQTRYYERRAYRRIGLLLAFSLTVAAVAICTATLTGNASLIAF